MSRKAYTGPVGLAVRQCPEVERERAKSARSARLSPVLSTTGHLTAFTIFSSFCYMCGPKVTDAKQLTSNNTALEGLQFNHFN